VWKIFKTNLQTAMRFGKRFALRHAYRSLSLSNLATQSGNEQRGFLFTSTNSLLNPVINDIYPDFFQARFEGVGDFKSYSSTNPVNNSLAIARTADFVAILTDSENSQKEHDDFLASLEDRGIDQKKVHFSVYNTVTNKLKFTHTHKNDSQWLTKRLINFNSAALQSDTQKRKEAVIACIDKRKNNMLYRLFPEADIMRTPGASIQVPGDCAYTDSSLARLKDYDNIHLIIHTDCVAVTQTIHGNMQDQVITKAMDCCHDHISTDNITKTTVQFSLENLQKHGISPDKVNIMLHDVDNQKLFIYNNKTKKFLTPLDLVPSINAVTLGALERIHQHNIVIEEGKRETKAKKFGGGK